MLLNKAIERNEQRFNKLQQTAEWALAHGLDRFNDLAYDIGIYDNRISIEISPEQFKEARKLLGNGWKLINCHSNSDTGSRFHNYQCVKEIKSETWPKEVTLMEQVTGKTQCTLVQTGVKEVPVYEIVCK